MRLNARLDDSYEEKFAYIQQTENKNRSDVIKEALEMYFAKKLNHEEQLAWEANQKLREKLSGCLSSDPEGSTQYKHHVRDYLNDKFPAR